MSTPHISRAFLIRHLPKHLKPLTRTPSSRDPNTCRAYILAYIWAMSDSADDKGKTDQALAAACAALVQQYGDDAEVVATMRAAEFAALGDVDGLAAWDMIIAYLVALREGRLPENEAVLN